VRRFARLISITNSPTTRYIRADSDGDLAFVSCATCGVTTTGNPRRRRTVQPYMAVNAALCGTTANLLIRHDGADTFAVP
jgi:hypothetical protein